MAWPLFAQSRPPIVNGVDLLVPTAPVAVRIAGRSNLVYELHVTNFQNVDVALVKLQVLADERAADVFAEYAGEELKQRLGRPGLSRQHEASEIIGPGMRALVYLWIELPDASSPPPALRHCLELDIRRPAGTVRTVVEGPLVRVSTETPIVLDPPVRGGPWAAIYDPLLMGGHRTAIYTVDGRARIPGRFAIDWVRLPPNGALETDALRRSPDWNGYGDEVLAVVDTTVAAAMDDISENADPPVVLGTPMPLEKTSGNYVALDLGNGRYAFYEHLLRGSLRVKAGDRVKSGDVIAKLGNSGSSSMGPHLHFHVADARATLGAEGLPFVLRQFELLGAFASFNALLAGERWQPVAPGPANVRRFERPGPIAVVRFR
jgi:murein DD-endopeptidase